MQKSQSILVEATPTIQYLYHHHTFFQELPERYFIHFLSSWGNIQNHRKFSFDENFWTNYSNLEFPINSWNCDRFGMQSYLFLSLKELFFPEFIRKFSLEEGSFHWKNSSFIINWLVIVELGRKPIKIKRIRIDSFFKGINIYFILVVNWFDRYVEKQVRFWFNITHFCLCYKFLLIAFENYMLSWKIQLHLVIKWLHILLCFCHTAWYINERRILERYQGNKLKDRWRLCKFHEIMRLAKMMSND